MNKDFKRKIVKHLMNETIFELVKQPTRHMCFRLPIKILNMEFLLNESAIETISIEENEFIGKDFCIWLREFYELSDDELNEVLEEYKKRLYREYDKFTF